MVEFSINCSITLDYEFATVRTHSKCGHLHLLKVPPLGTGLLYILIYRVVN